MIGSRRVTRRETPFCSFAYDFASRLTAARKQIVATLQCPRDLSSHFRPSHPCPPPSRSTPSTPPAKAPPSSSALARPSSPTEYEKYLASLAGTKPDLSVAAAYAVVRKHTGSIGGNASGGEIYGEQTIGSMNRVVMMLKRFCGFDEGSRFIDVGAGLGKPNIHVAADPGCEFSYGVEVNKER